MSTQPTTTRKWDTAVEAVLLRARRRPYYTLSSILGSALVLVLIDELLMPAAMPHMRVSPVLGFAIRVAIGIVTLFTFYRVLDAVAQRKRSNAP